MKACKPSEVFSRNYSPLTTVAIGALVALAACTNALLAQPIAVSNYSFESQVVNPIFFVDSHTDNWQKTPQPGYFTPTPLLTWDQTVGMFIGTPPFSPNPYSNLVGNQAAYMLPLPGVGIFQDSQSVDWNGTVGGLSATYQPGYAYQFTVGIFGKSMVESYSSMQLSLYYRDGTNMVPVGVPTAITFSTNTFNPGGPFVLHDYSVTTPIVQAGDAWAGKNIGIKIESLLGDGSGYWDMDNVRLTAVVPEPTSLSLLAIGLGGAWLARARSRRQAYKMSLQRRRSCCQYEQRSYACSTTRNSRSILVQIPVKL